MVLTTDALFQQVVTCARCNSVYTAQSHDVMHSVVDNNFYTTCPVCRKHVQVTVASAIVRNAAPDVVPV